MTNEQLKIIVKAINEGSNRISNAILAAGLIGVGGDECGAFQVSSKIGEDVMIAAKNIRKHDK